MASIQWTKPNGNKIETNDLKATVEHCESLKWERGKAAPPKTAKSEAQSEPEPVNEPAPETTATKPAV